ncbi:guanylate kinase [Candidatus Kaiserbacteria bacterium]|nr:guanylate kinase [Candidatus Kaiserbacteria bacterium]
MEDKGKRVVVIAGPGGSGKDALARALVKRYSNLTMLVSATTRPRRPTEIEGVNYYFMTNERFQEELAAGNILEHYHRAETDTYYGTYKPDIEKRLESGKIVVCQIQFVGAQYLKEHYGATTFFIIPASLENLERRIRARAPISDVEWEERKRFTQHELAEEAPWYDYRIRNDDGKLDEAVDNVAEILQREGYQLE